MGSTFKIILISKLDLTSPQIMGILNATPDSFSDGGKYVDLPRALDRIHLMKKGGATIIDIGGESMRPGAEPVSVKEELKRIKPIFEATKAPYFSSLAYSIDTTKYEIAEFALNNGAAIINDVSGLQKEPRMAELAAAHNATYIIMHSKRDPQTMQDAPEYDDVVNEVFAFLEKQVAFARSKGVEQIIIDPGIGFGKSLAHNLTLLAHLDKFKKIGVPILVGASRKSMIGKILDDRPVEDRLIGTVSVHYDCLTKGAKILRVHDVKEASDSLRIFQAIQSQY